jgi:N-acetylmuramoyl-L-alanine amidase
MSPARVARFRHVAVLVWCAGAWSCAATPLGGPFGQPPPYPYLEAPLFSRPIRTVVVDAGHGGHDPGTSHYGLREKDLALDVARRLRHALEAAGLRVIMTREGDQFVPLSRRPDLANRLQADLFLSVHINANANRRVQGIEVYYPRASVVPASASWPPDVASGEVAMPTTTVKQVLWDLVLGQTRHQSKALAATICRSMAEELKRPCRAVKPARFVVLREAWMPAVLVEVGYVSNRAEANRLGSAAHRQAAARSIADGVLAYIRQLDVQHI